LERFKIVPIQSRTVHNRPLTIDHSKQTTIITDPFIIDLFKIGAALAGVGPNWKHFCGALVSGVCRHFDGGIKLIYKPKQHSKQKAYTGSKYVICVEMTDYKFSHTLGLH